MAAGDEREQQSQHGGDTDPDAKSGRRDAVTGYRAEIAEIQRLLGVDDGAREGAGENRCEDGRTNAEADKRKGGKRNRPFQREAVAEPEHDTEDGVPDDDVRVRQRDLGRRNERGDGDQSDDGPHEDAVEEADARCGRPQRRPHDERLDEFAEQCDSCGQPRGCGGVGVDGRRRERGEHQPENEG